MAKGIQDRDVSLSFRTTAAKARILEAIQLLRKDESRTQTLNHALDVLFGGYKIKTPSAQTMAELQLPWEGDSKMPPPTEADEG